MGVTFVLCTIGLLCLFFYWAAIGAGGPARDQRRFRRGEVVAVTGESVRIFVGNPSVAAGQELPVHRVLRGPYPAPRAGGVFHRVDAGRVRIDDVEAGFARATVIAGRVLKRDIAKLVSPAVARLRQ